MPSHALVRIRHHSPPPAPETQGRGVWLGNRQMFELVAASVCNCFQTIVAFTFLSMVPPVTYSVVNVSKRVGLGRNACEFQ